MEGGPAIQFTRPLGVLVAQVLGQGARLHGQGVYGTAAWLGPAPPPWIKS